MLIDNVHRLTTDYIISRKVEKELFNRLEAKACYIEVVGSTCIGKTTLVQNWIIQNRNDYLKDYELIGWIDCSSYRRACNDILTLSQALGKPTQQFGEAANELIKYCQANPKHLLVLDGLNTEALRAVKEVFELRKGTLIYITAESLQTKINKILSLTLNIRPIKVPRFEVSEVQELVVKHLASESIEGCDFSYLTDLTSGQPQVIMALCRHYETSSEYGNFAKFLDYLQNQKSLPKGVDTLIRSIVDQDIKRLEQDKSSSEVTNALTMLKQAAWLSDQPIPLGFFQNHQETNDLAIKKLINSNLTILEYDRANKSLRVVPAFIDALKEKYHAEQAALFAKNTQRLYQIFNYLTNNERTKLASNQPETLVPYADLVSNLLFEIYEPGMLSKNSPLFMQLLTLGSSLARLYYIYYGELQLAFMHLTKAFRFFESCLSDTLIARCQADSATQPFDLSTVSEEDKALLKLYAEEYLCQKATIGSQLTTRNQVDLELIDNFQKAYTMQKNLGVEPISIAHTLRNLTRALRKAGQLDESIRLYAEMKDLAQSFDPIDAAPLVIDEGIIKKEKQDNLRKEYRDYREAISIFKKAQAFFQTHNQNNRFNKQLSFLSLYLGEAYLANEQFEEGITSIYHMLHYDGKVKWKQARVYFDLAKAFEDKHYLALASLYVEKAVLLQTETYKEVTNELRLKIQTALCNAPEVQCVDSYSVDDCADSLLKNTGLGKTLSLVQIQTHNDRYHAWSVQQRMSKTQVDLHEQIAREKEAIDAKAKQRDEKIHLQETEQALWYDTLKQRIDLTDTEHKKARAFSQELEVGLLRRVAERLKIINGEEGPIDKQELTARLFVALANLIPKVGMHIGLFTFEIDPAAAVQETAKVAQECHDRSKKSNARNELDKYQGPEQLSEDSRKVGEYFKKEMQQVSEYVTRCYDNQLKNAQLTQKDITKLAEEAAERIMKYNYINRADNLHPNEIAIHALSIEQKYSKFLKNKVIKGFFEKPGIQLQISKSNDKALAFYLNPQADPNRYGFRWGSPYEIERIGCRGPFDSAEDAQHDAESCHISRCVLM